MRWLALMLMIATVASCSKREVSLFALPEDARLMLFEGLPHQGYEPTVFDEEKKKPAVEMGGFLFYEQPLPLNDADAHELRRIVVDPSTYVPFFAEKKCGGFHPDYAIKAKSATGETVYLICFGCGEAKIIRPDGSMTRYELDNNYTSLHKTLKPYRKNRPRIRTGSPLNPLMEYREELNVRATRS